MTCRRSVKGPWLTPIHAQRRLQWAREKFGVSAEYWDNFVCSDDKKFNVDELDGLARYWHDLQNKPRIFSKRYSGGGSVMVLSCFSVKVLSPFAFVTTTINGPWYFKVLEQQLLPFLATHHDGNAVFMQDGASPHRANVTKNWLLSRNINVLDWPARSPDLNPIENLWRMLARLVYKGGNQFSTWEELRGRIAEVWDEVEMEALKNFAKSFPDRIGEVLTKNGRQTKY